MEDYKDYGIYAVYVQGKKVDMDRANRLAQQFGVELISGEIDKNADRYFLMDKTGLSFFAGGQELKGDFTRLLSRTTGGHLQHEILLKTAKQGAEEAPGHLRAVDATAGLGEDSFLLAAGGYQVEMFEHNPVTAAILQDALVRARNNAQLKEVAKRMTLRQGDSKELLKTLSYIPDLIYLDPMFPEKKKSAESKKKMQVLHQIEAPCQDEVELVEATLATGSKKIIIKRPPEAPYLAGITPVYSVERKAVRYDCLIGN